MSALAGPSALTRRFTTDPLTMEEGNAVSHTWRPAHLLLAVRRRLWHRLELCFYCRDLAALTPLPAGRFLRRDRFEDLRYYHRSDLDQLSEAAYRQEARRRHAAGYHLYTYVQGERLLYYGWLVDRQQRSEDPQMGQVFLPPPHSSVIFDCFVHPIARGKGLYQRALILMMHEARDTAGATQICMGAFADNVISRHVLGKLGFHQIGSMVLKRRFGLHRRSVVAITPEFRAELL